MTTVVTGYKATDKDMKCRDFQFELGVWHEFTGDVIFCEAGFHFCLQPSGVYSYYPADTSRVFRIEAEGVLETPEYPGSDNKKVCRRIRLVEEITPPKGSDYNTGHYNTGQGNTGNYSTGNRNTGHRNTGDRNTGHRNTGDWNTGDRNTGNYSTGNRNTGHRNTGDNNTGHRNTGDRNTGHRNTGHRNTGDGNTGHRNTGDRNTGDYNACNYSSGFFCTDAPVLCFNAVCGLSRNELRGMDGFGQLSDLLCNKQDTVPPATPQIKELPNFTDEKYLELVSRYWNYEKPE